MRSTSRQGDQKPFQHTANVNQSSRRPTPPHKTPDQSQSLDSTKTKSQKQEETERLVIFIIQITPISIRPFLTSYKLPLPHQSRTPAAKWVYAIVAATRIKTAARKTAQTHPNSDANPISTSTPSRLHPLFDSHSSRSLFKIPRIAGREALDAFESMIGIAAFARGRRRNTPSKPSKWLRRARSPWVGGW